MKIQIKKLIKKYLNKFQEMMEILFENNCCIKLSQGICF